MNISLDSHEVVRHVQDKILRRFSKFGAWSFLVVKFKQLFLTKHMQDPAEISLKNQLSVDISKS